MTNIMIKRIRIFSNNAFHHDVYYRTRLRSISASFRDLDREASFLPLA